MSTIIDNIIAAAKRAAIRWFMSRVKLPGIIQIQRDPVRDLSSRDRDVVYQRDGGHCRYCGEGVQRYNAHFDHVYPWSRGGETSANNIVTSCQRCNLSKGDSIGKMWPLPIK